VKAHVSPGDGSIVVAVSLKDLSKEDRWALLHRLLQECGILDRISVEGLQALEKAWKEASTNV
jgi:hypothetical protein